MSDLFFEMALRKLLVILLVAYTSCRPDDSRASDSSAGDIPQGTPSHSTNGSKFAVVGYLPEWRYNGLDWEAVSDHLTHLIFFSIEVDSQGSFAAMDRFAFNHFLFFFCSVYLPTYFVTFLDCHEFIHTIDSFL